MGLAHVAIARGDLTHAQNIFEDILSENPGAIAALDGLAKVYHLQQDTAKLQTTVAKATKLSPYAILRQKNLANIAEANGDITTAIKALKECVKLGQNSCHGDWHDAYRLGLNAADAAQTLAQCDDQLPLEALQSLKTATDFFKLNNDDLMCAQLLQGRLQYLSQRAQGEQAIQKTEELYLQAEKRNIVTDIARVKVNAPLTKSNAPAVTELSEYYAGNQSALKQLDSVLDEPIDSENRQLLAAANKQGIELYQQQKFDEAIHCFQKAQVLFPLHIGVQLNICQAHLGKLKSHYGDDLAAQVNHQLHSIGKKITASTGNTNVTKNY